MFGEDLDLSAVLPKYQKILDEQTPDLFEVPVLDNTDTPTRVGGGVLTVSSSRELETYPSICWDVNGYYRDLGVHWKAGRRQLMEAYRDRGGPDNPRLTYILRQLLDEETRREYDLMPYGSVYMDDYVQEEIVRNAKAESARRVELGVWSTPEKILREWGFALEEEVSKDLPVSNPSPPPPGGDEGDGWPFSFLQLGTTCADTEIMVRWQGLLLEALMDVPTTFAVGYTGRDDGFRIGTYRGVTVFYLSDVEDPSEELAEELVSLYLGEDR